VVPVADIEPVALPDRMMAAGWSPVRPGVLLAAGLPLPRDPPAADFDGLRRVGEVEDHHDVADIALDGRRDVGVAAVEVIAVDALAVRLPLRDKLRLGRPRHVADAEAAAEPGGRGLPRALVVDDHDAVGHTHLVRVPPGRDLDPRQRARLPGIGDVDDRRAGRLAHMADIEGGAVDPDLAAAGAIDMGDMLRVLALGHDRRIDPVLIRRDARLRRTACGRASGRTPAPSASARRSPRTEWPARGPKR